MIQQAYQMYFKSDLPKVEFPFTEIIDINYKDNEGIEFLWEED